MRHQHQHTQTIRFVLYGRKSSEAEDRQILSIESQTDNMRMLARKEALDVLSEPMTEAKSAKSPGRTVFNQMIERLKQGEANGIICWKLDRLARNFEDGGMIIQLLQTGVIKQIVTHDKTYYPDDNVLTLAVEFGMANQFVRDLSVNVKRGLRTKYERGFPTGVAKIGYINKGEEKGDKWIEADHERFHLVKQVWEKYLTGNFSVRRLQEFSDKTLGLRSIQRKKEGGRPIKLANLYNMLRDPFFAGFFYGKDENGEMARYEVHPSVPRIVTEEQYWQIQKMLGRKGRPCPSVNKNLFPYVGRVKCGTCTGSITAENKHQLICSECKFKFVHTNKTCCPKCQTSYEDMNDPTYLHYIYYHCIKRKNPNCPERSVQEKDIDAFLSDYFLNNLEVSPDLRDWSLKHLDELDQHDTQNEEARRVNWKEEKVKKEDEYQELIRMKMKNMIDEDEFLKLKTSMKAEIQTIDRTLQNIGESDQEVAERIKKAFTLAVGVSEIFKSGTYQQKIEALSELSSNLTLQDKKLNVFNDSLFTSVINGIYRVKQEHPAFEPRNFSSTKSKTDAFDVVGSTWLGGWDSNPRPIGYT